MGKLHELLAVESDKLGVANKIIEETHKVFISKHEHFEEFHKHLESFLEDERTDASEEHRAMVTTVPKKIKWMLDSFMSYLDLLYQKELTNRKACSDLTIGGTTIAKDVPAVYLLGLENKFKAVRKVFEVLPTLKPGVEWTPDEQRGDGVYKAVHTEKKFKTAKTFQHQVLYDATKEHPAQIEKWEETKNVGVYNTERYSGMTTPLKKAMYLSRIDQVIQACKKARQRANCEPIVSGKIGKNIIDFILND